MNRNSSTQSEDIISHLPISDNLKANGFKYIDLFNNMQEGVTLHQLIYSPSGKAVNYRIIAVNPAFENIVGLKSSDVINQLATEICHTSQAPYLKEFTEVVETNKISIFEVYYSPLGRNFRIVAFSKSPGMFTTLLIDITEQKKAQQSLVSSETELHTLFTAMTDVVIVYDAEGHYVKIAPTNPENFTKSPNKMLGKTVFNILPKEKAAFVFSKIRETLQTHAKVACEYSLDISGKETWFAANVTPLSENEVIWVAHDITKQMKTEDTLRINEERFRAIFEQAAVGVAQLETKTGRYININKKYCDLLGYTMEEMLEKTFIDVSYTDDIQVNIENNAKLITGEITEFSLEKRYIRKDGSIMWGSLTASPIWKPGEKPVTYYHIAILEDITDRKKTLKALHENREQLHSLTSYWQTAIENERTTISREIHDELGQSMTALKMDLSWLSNHLPKNDEYIERIRGMNNLVDESINLMRRIASDLRPNLLDDLGLATALEWQAHEFSKRNGICCNLNLYKQPIFLEEVVRTNMFRIFQETLTNVARHSNATQVDIKLELLDQTLVLTVRDNGRGIINKELNSRHSLGLLGMRERATMLGGGLTINGVPDEGTTVSVSVPLLDLVSHGDIS